MKVSARSGKTSASEYASKFRRRERRCSWWAHLKSDCPKYASMQEKVEFFRPLLKPRPKPELTQPNPSGEVIHIPPMMTSREFSEYEMSARLRSALGFNNYWRLGDLDGVAYDHLLALRNCGKVTVAELKRLVKRIQNEAEFDGGGHSRHGGGFDGGGHGGGDSGGCDGGGGH